MHVAFAQEIIELRVRSQDKSEDILNRYKFKQKHLDSLSAMRTAQGLVVALHNDGYLLATLHRSELNQGILTVWIEVGPLFERLALRPGNVDPFLLKKISYRKYGNGRSHFSYQNLAKLENDLLRYAERNGHPFASLRYDSLEILSGEISAALNLDLGPRITFDSVRLDGNVLKRSFLESHLGLQMADLYDEQKVERTVTILAAMPYLRLTKAPELSFQNEEATLYLELEKRRINRIDGVIGFLPRSGSNNGLLVTGQFDMDLYNPFLTGKYIGIHWTSPQEKSQVLNMIYDHPNVLKSPLSFRGEFDFLKQDTTFTKLDFRADLDIRLGNGSSLAVFTTITSSNLLATGQFTDALSLPAFADIDQNLYGLAFRLNQLDDPLLPKEGLRFSMSAGLGNKHINPIAALSNELYQGVDLRSVQYQIDLQSSYYTNLKERWNLKLDLRGGFIDNKNLFVNDAYRIGGLNTIRGFDENFFFATKYISSIIENRFYFESNSYLSLFADFGVLENIVQEKRTEGFLGFGTGISFETQRGIFNLVYALGTSQSVGPIDVNRSKIHFGFTTRF